MLQCVFNSRDTSYCTSIYAHAKRERKTKEERREQLDSSFLEPHWSARAETLLLLVDVLRYIHVKRSMLCLCKRWSVIPGVCNNTVKTPFLNKW